MTAPTHGRWFRISLRMLLVVVTLCCVTLWWWQKPYEIESTIVLYKKYVGQENGQPVFDEVEGRRGETMRRQWGDDPVKHGPTREYDLAGNLVFEEQWQSGIRHGLYRRWDFESLDLIAELEFERGRLVRVGETVVHDFMSDMVAEGASGERMKTELVRDTAFDYTGQPMKDVIEDISFNGNIPIAIDAPALQAAGIQLDSPIVSDTRGMPFFAALCATLAPLNLTCDYQYETLWITTSDSLLGETYVDLSQANPQLLDRMKQPGDMDYVDQPLEDVLSDFSSRYQISIQSEMEGHDTLNVSLQRQGMSLHALLGSLCYLHGLRCEADRESLIFRLADDLR